MCQISRYSEPADRQRTCQTPSVQPKTFSPKNAPPTALSALRTTSHLGSIAFINFAFTPFINPSFSSLRITG